MKSDPIFYSDYTTETDYILLRDYINDDNSKLNIIVKNNKHQNIGAISFTRNSLEDFILELMKIHKTLTA